MRLSPLALLALPVAWVACFSNSSGSGGGPNVDASQDVTFPVGDAAEDLATIDAPADAAHDVTSGGDASEAGPPAVSILVFGASGPENGVSIVFGDATGAVVGAPATTGVQGLVNQALPPGASTITALLGTATNPAPYTVMGVQPGDSIVVPDVASLTPFESDAVDVTALPAPPPMNAATYGFTVGACPGSGAMPPYLVPLTGTACFGLGASGGTYHAVVNVLVEAYDANANLLGFTFQKGYALSGIDGGALAVSLAADTWSTTTTKQELAIANQPDGSAVTTHVGEAANAVLRQLPQLTVVDDAGVQHTVVTTHVGYAAALQTEVAISNPQWAIGTAVGAAPPASSGALTIDATSLGKLPQITSVTADSSVAGRPKLTWTLAQGSLGVTTGLVAYTSWSQTDAGTSINGNWTVVAPSSVTSIQVHALPASASSYQPPAGALVYGAVQGLVGSVIGSYGQLRTVGAAIASPYQPLGCVASPVLPAIGTGMLSVTIYTQAVCG
jgi:hypothetical protein